MLPTDRGGDSMPMRTRRLVAETRRKGDAINGRGDGKRRAAGVQRLLGVGPGAPQNAITASPMNLSIVPFSSAIAFDARSR